MGIGLYTLNRELELHYRKFQFTVVFNIKTWLFRCMYKFAVLLNPLVSGILPPKFRQKVKKFILKVISPNRRNSSNSHGTNMNRGINLLGYAWAEMGVGESCRNAAKGIEAGGIPFGIINFTGTNSARMSDLTWAHKEIHNPVYDINVFHINAEQMMEIYAEYGKSLFENRYNIGYWHWELPDFPDEWIESFKFVDEIWAPSTFVGEAISKKSPVPVVKIPHAIEVKINEKRNRSYFNLPEDTFLFLTMYDIKSYQERKNPRASIDAFKGAFGPEDRDVGLVIKVNSYKSNPVEFKSLLEIISDYPNIYLMKETISRNDINSLILVTDCFISLHRSEGFGLGFAEAMYLGKPVIGTNWSSNTDFMNDQNSCLVDYKLIPVGQDYGPYKSYQHWADPDTNHASEYMRRLVNDELYYKLISCNGERYIKENYSPTAIGELITKRLEYIYKWKNGG